MAKPFRFLPWLLCIAGLLGGVPTFAQGLTLPQAVEATLAVNPRLSGFQFRHQALEGARATAALGPQRQIALQLDDVAGSGEMRGVDSAELSLSLSSVIEPAGLRNARVATVDSQRQQLVVEQQQEALALLSDVTRQFIRTTAAWDRWQLQREAQQLSREIQRQVEQRVQSGAAPEADSLRARAAVTRQTLITDQAEQQFREERLLLGSFWQENNPVFEAPKARLIEQPRLPPLSELLARVEQHPAWQRAREEERVQLAQQRELERRAGLSWEWQAGVKHLRTTDDTALTMGVSVPLGSRQRATGALTESRARQSLLAQERDYTRYQASVEIRRRYDAWQQQWHSIDRLQRELLPVLQQTLTATRSAFERGRYGYQELQTIQQELLQARLLQVEVAEAAHLAGVDLEWLTGLAVLPETSSSESALRLP